MNALKEAQADIMRRKQEAGMSVATINNPTSTIDDNAPCVCCTFEDVCRC